jgi:signal peptide peptidase SppA
MQLLDLLLSPWAIAPDMLREIQAIYATHLRGEKIDIEALEARLGRPLANDQQEYRVEEGGIAVLPIEGVMAPKANLFMRVSGGASTQMLTKQIESAMADARVKGLVLAIDSPGGSVFGAPELASAIYRMSQEKPIATVGENRMASAAYWAGSAANALFISGPTVEAGSIGVVGTHSYDPRGAQGVTEITAGKYKRIATPNAPLTKEGREYLQAQVDHVYTVFVNAVAVHRGVTPEQVLEHMADGRVFIGQQAIDAGLVDGVATVDEVVAQMADNPDAFMKRRKAKVMSVSASKTANHGAGAAPASAPPQPSNPQGTKSMDIEKLKAEHGDVYQAALALGATAERARIQAVQAALIPGHEALIQKLMFDGTTSGGDAALAVNAAERQVRETQAKGHKGDAPHPVTTAPAPAAPPPAAEAREKAEAERIAALPVDERCKAAWDANKDGVRAEFTDLGSFTAFTKANEAGKVRMLRKSA